MEEHSQHGTQSFGGAALALLIAGIAVLVLACAKATTYSLRTMGLVILVALVLFFLAVEVWHPVDNNQR